MACRLALAAALAVLVPAGAVLRPAPLAAQNLFASRLEVNGQAITEFEIAQRAQFLQLLGEPGDLRQAALQALVDDKLRMQEAKRLGLKLDEKQVRAGMEEFAARANLTADELVAELQKIGIAPETYRDFVTAGLAWRELVRARYAGHVPVSEADIDKALAQQTQANALKVQVSELVIPAPPGQEAAAMAKAEQLARTIRGEASFAAAARSSSAAATAKEGGAVPGWLPLSRLPAEVADRILALAPGQVSAPVALPGSVVLFLLRAVAPDENAPAVPLQVEWAEFLLPDDPARIAAVEARADSCNDLYGLAKGMDPGMLTLRTQAMAEVPKDVAYELAKLDLGEISAALTRQGHRRLVMLCARVPAEGAAATRDQIRDRIINQRLEGLAATYLEELRHAAIIREP